MIRIFCPRNVVRENVHRVELEIHGFPWLLQNVCNKKPPDIVNTVIKFHFIFPRRTSKRELRTHKQDHGLGVDQLGTQVAVLRVRVFHTLVELVDQNHRSTATLATHVHIRDEAKFVFKFGRGSGLLARDAWDLYMLHR